jgi:hypothetical protein
MRTALYLIVVSHLAACGQEPFPRGPQTETPDDNPELSDPPLEGGLQNESNLRFDGIGEVTIGETLAEASGALGEDLTHHAPAEGSTCSYAFSTTMPGVAFMLDGETIVRIDVTEGGITTPEAVGIGDTEAAIRAAYGADIEITPHKYVEGGHYFTVAGPASTGPDLHYVFATDGSAITSFRAGRMPQVEWIEGCS